MKYDISFLHTGEVHIENFDQLVKQLAPALKVKHSVNASFLEQAQISGMHDDLVSQISTVLEALRREAKIVIVTCSSIGDVAEMVKSDDSTHVMRIDRPMADFAVANGDNILIVATVESTIKPTLALLESSAARLNKTVHFNLHCIADAWSYFTSSDHNAYLNTIATDLQSHENKYDLIVLAQASMAKVEALVSLSTPLLSSPKIGVAHAISLLKR
jgi:hypothetical protein